MLVMSTLKNYILACYNSDDNLRISEQQKSILRVNILNIYYEINNDLQAVNLYE